MPDAIGPHGMPIGWQPELGRLPRDPEKPALLLRALAVPVALPTPPTELHNIELDPDTVMLGNNVEGNCVFVSIERDRRISAAALGVKITWLTAAQVVAKYHAYTGISTPPGPGAVAQTAYNWVRKDPAGWGGNHLLFFAEVPQTELAIRQACSEFQSVITCEVIRAAQEYPAKTWDHTTTAVLGGHATPGGTYTAMADFLKTWGYIVRVTPAFFANDIDEIDVLVWDFQWETLTYERQVTLIADIQTLTGKTWTGPAPVPPVVVSPPRSAVNITAIPPVRLLDTRSGNGLSGKFTAHVPRSVQIAGRGTIPAGAAIVTGNLTVCNAAAKGNVAVGPDPIVKPDTSTLNFKAGDELANGFTSALRADGTLALVLGDGTSADLILDITAYFTP
jgi:hypothetical protein